MGGEALPLGTVDGVVWTPEQWRALTRALGGLTVPNPDDNGGDPVWIKSLGLPFKVSGDDPNLRTICVSPGATYEGDDDVWFVTTLWSNTTAGNQLSVTPNGGSAWSLPLTSVANVSGRVVAIIAGGDKITAAASAPGGILGFLMTAPSDCARVLEVCTNTNPYTVERGYAAILTAAQANPSALITGRGGGGSSGPIITTLGGSVAANLAHHYFNPVYLRGGDAFAPGTASTDVLVSGITFPVTE